LPAPPPVLLLFGPTAVGKTDLSIRLAESLDTELVYADSMAVYRGMDVGTAKPSVQERKRVRHHLIDVADPAEEFSVQRFLDLACPVIRELVQLRRVPVVVGGTGLYIRALTRGLVDAPSANPAITEELESLAERMGPEYLHRELERVDAHAARRISPRDRRRLVRALSVFREQGRSITHFQNETATRLPYRFLRLGLHRERAELYRRINDRVDQMIQGGLQLETENLMKRGISRSARQALGYKEMLDYLEGQCSLEEAVVRIKSRTRRLAKRQLTWFRAEPGVHWVDMSAGNSFGLIMELVSGFLVE